MSSPDIDTTTDIYSLGVVLYELLVGALPFDAATLRRAGYDEIRRIVREEQPPKPSIRFRSLGKAAIEIAKRRQTDCQTLAKELRSDLGWILSKAMEKERTRRYASASELAADIERHLRDEPVLAGPPSAAYRASKFMRKHRGALAGALAAFLFLVVSLFGMTALNFVNAMQLQLDGTLRTEAYIRNQVSWLVRKAVARQPQLSIADALRHDEIELDLMQILAEAPAVLEIAICDQRNEILVDSDPARRYTFQVYPDFAKMVNDTGSFEKLRILVRSTQLYQLEQALGSKREEMALHVRIVIAPALVRNEISPSLRKLSVVELFGDVLAGLMFLFLFLSWLWFRR